MPPVYDDGLIPSSPPSGLEYVTPRPPPFSDKAIPYEQAPVYQQPRTICGLRRMTFFLLVVIALLIIVGAVGGGVGGSLAVKNAQNAANSASNTASTSSPAATGTSSSLAVATVTVTATSTLPTQSPVTAPELSCPADNSSTYTAANGGQYNIICDMNYPNSDLQISNNTANFDLCIENCAYYNRLNPTVPCVGVVFTHTINYCWLKSYFGPGGADDSSWSATCVGCKSL